MPLWGAVDNDASEPKNLAEGEFQGTAGKKIYGVDNNEQGIVNGKTGDARMQHHMLDGLELLLTQTCMVISELKLKF